MTAGIRASSAAGVAYVRPDVNRDNWVTIQFLKANMDGEIDELSDGKTLSLPRLLWNNLVDGAYAERHAGATKPPKKP